MPLLKCLMMCYFMAMAKQLWTAHGLCLTCSTNCFSLGWACYCKKSIRSPTAGAGANTTRLSQSRLYPAFIKKPVSCNNLWSVVETCLYVCILLLLYCFVFYTDSISILPPLIHQTWQLSIYPIVKHSRYVNSLI